MWEMGCEIMKFSLTIVRTLLLSSVIFVCSLLCFGEIQTQAALTAKSIGKKYSETENGEAVTGVHLLMNGQSLDHAYDVWQYTHAGGWQFQYANLTGTRYQQQNLQVSSGRFLVLMEPSGSNNRVLVLVNQLKPYLKENAPDGYMIETIRYQKGEEISRDYEYSNDNAIKWADSAYSLMMKLTSGLNLRYAACNPEEISCIYQIYSGMRIGEGAGLPVTATGASITQDGMAYWKDLRYMVKSLPKAERPQDRYRYELEGWYTEPEGGEEITEGSLIKAGTPLYAHWKKIPVSYPVTCLDILQDGEREQVLGMHTWQAEYGDMVSGASMGDSSQPGKYYEGRDYIDCSQAVVDTQGATVYRYFRNSLMTVTCIDEVSEGPNSGRLLGKTAWQAPYTEIVSGGSFGCQPEIGGYYRGYQFASSTTQQVGLQGCTVYRYFQPVSYDIQFVANCTGGGVMAPIRNCYYDSEYTLTQNTFVNKYRLDLELNAQDASCDTAYQYVYPEFAGWSDSPQGGVLYSDGCRISNLREEAGTATLYAIWSEKEITVTAQPKRLGYEFVGWSEDPKDNRGRKQFYIDQDETLYAIWKPAPVTYHVEYYKQNLNQSFTLSSQYEFSAYTDSKVSLEDLDGLYSGFYLDRGASNLSGVVKADGSLVLSAYFRRGEYTLYFDENGGTVVHSGSILPAITDVFEKEVTIPNVLLSKKGYEFGGWGIDRDLNQVAARPGDKFSMQNHDQTLYAVWIPQENTSFTVVPYYENVNGMGYIQGEKLILTGITEDTVEEGICRFYATDLAQSVRIMFGDGYELVSEKELRQNRIQGDGSTTVELYLSLKKYTVSFYEDQGDYSSTLITTQDVVYGQDIYLSESIGTVDLVESYQDEKGELYYPGDIVTITGYKSFLVKKRIFYPGETRNPQNSKPVQPTDSPQSQETKEPSGLGTAIQPEGGILPTGSEQPHENVVPESPDNKTEDDSQVSVISAWIGATPDPNEIAAILDQNKESNLPKKGQQVTKKGIVYQVTSSTEGKRTVKTMRLKKTVSHLVIPSTIQIKGYSYQVTAIQKNAFAGKTKIKTVTLGENIRKIGKKAFYGNGNLKRIKIQSRNVKVIGAAAWKGASPKLQIQFGKNCSILCKKRVLSMYQKMK